MANAVYSYLELRFIIEREWTDVYVLLSAPSDGTLGVQGWHVKRFPVHLSIVQIVTRIGASMPDDPVMWPMGAPPEHATSYDYQRNRPGVL